MKAARIHDYGHSDRIAIEEIPPPEPASDQVLVAIRDAGVNPVDWKIREGYFAKIAPRPLPFTLGQDFCGEVLTVGPGVTELQAGEEVYGFADGTYADFVAVSPKTISTKPSFVTDAVAASLPTPGLTAMQIVEEVQPTQGQSILIQGAAGAVGSIATQLCLARKATVHATAARTDAAYLTGLGVADTIDYRTEQFEDRVRDVDVVIDLVGGETFARSLAVVRDGGLIVTTVASVDELGDRRVRAVRIVMRKNQADLVELARLVDEGIVVPRSPRVLPIEQARAAQDLTESHAAGKLVLAVQV